MSAFARYRCLERHEFVEEVLILDQIVWLNVVEASGLCKSTANFKVQM